mmetsp:Transcript_33669/g.77724  ORF Transcript_33669/g.77724 Transcript_33669/m.77724 type:complete len:235 (-) Transcript_33669:485-1189(-)
MVATLPFASRNHTSLFILRVMALPPFTKGASRVPRKMPKMLQYILDLSSASTADTESSMSRMAVRLLSVVMSLMPLKAAFPMGWERSISRIRWRPLCFRKIRPWSGTEGLEDLGTTSASGGPRFPWEPTNSEGVRSAVAVPSFKRSSSRWTEPTNLGQSRQTSPHFPATSGAISSSRPFAKSTTASPLMGLYPDAFLAALISTPLLVTEYAGMTSKPYRASYKDPQRALMAFST